MQPRTIPLAFATGLVTLPAWAQTNPPAPSSTPPTTAAPAQSGSGQFLTQEKPGQWRASKLRGLDVYNNSNEKIGDIREVLLNRDGKAEAVVIGVGGFLGIGERDVALPFSAIKFVDQPRTASATDTRPAGANAPPTPAAPVPTTAPAPANGPATTGSTTASRTAANDGRSYPDHAVVNMSRDQLRNAPAFQYAR